MNGEGLVQQGVYTAEEQVPRHGVTLEEPGRHLNSQHKSSWWGTPWRLRDYDFAFQCRESGFGPWTGC